MKRLKLLFAAGFAMLLVGCTTGVVTENMISTETNLNYEKAFLNNVKVGPVLGVQVGKDFNKMLNIKMFITAVEKSLEAAGLYSETGKYTLQINRIKITGPTGIVETTSTSHVQYILLESETNEVIFRKTVKMSHTATTSDAFAGLTRVILSLENAFQKNLKSFLQDLSQIKKK